jgi:hypothetical protein
VVSAVAAAVQEVAAQAAQGWQDWRVKMNRPTIAEIIGVHLPDESIRIAGGLD